MLDVWEVGESGIDDLRTSNRPHSSRPKRSPGAASWLWPTFDLGVQDWLNIGFPIKTVVLGVYLVGKPWANPRPLSAKGCNLHFHGTVGLPGRCWRRGHLRLRACSSETLRCSSLSVSPLDALWW